VWVEGTMGHRSPRKWATANGDKRRCGLLSNYFGYLIILVVAAALVAVAIANEKNMQTGSVGCSRSNTDVGVVGILITS